MQKVLDKLAQVWISMLLIGAIAMIGSELFVVFKRDILYFDIICAIVVALVLTFWSIIRLDIIDHREKESDE